VNLSFTEWFYNYGDDQILVENTISQLIKADKNLEEKFNAAKDRNPILNPVNWPQFLSRLNDNNKIILKKWLFYRIDIKNDLAPTGIDPLSDMDVMAVDPNSFVKQNMTNPDYDWDDLRQKNNEYHAQLAATKQRTYPPQQHEAELTVMKSYPNGLAWGRFEAGYCKQYGQSMGHCGNVTAKSGDRIYTFYDQKTHIHYLTFIVNDGLLGEAKAVDNSKPPIKTLSLLNRPDLPAVNIQPYYRDFFLLKEDGKYLLRSVKGGGYKPENNLRFYDLEKQYQDEIEEELPQVGKYHEIQMEEAEKEMQEISDESNLKHFSAHFNVDTYDEDKFYIDYSAYFGFEIPADMLEANAQNIISKARRDISDELTEFLHNHDVYNIQDVSFDFDDNGLQISISIGDDDEHTPNNFRYFLGNLESADNAYDQISSRVHDILHEWGVTKPTLLHQKEKELGIEHEDRNSYTYSGFENIDAEYGKKTGTFTFSLKNSIPINVPYKSIDSTQLKNDIKEAFYAYANKIKEFEDSQKSLFQEPEFQPAKTPVFGKDANIDITVLNRDNVWYINFDIELHHLSNPKMIEDTWNFLKMFDSRFDTFMDIMYKVIGQHAKQRSAANPSS